MLLAQAAMARHAVHRLRQVPPQQLCLSLDAMGQSARAPAVNVHHPGPLPVQVHAVLQQVDVMVGDGQGCAQLR